jgi:hypothetical protein
MTVTRAEVQSRFQRYVAVRIVGIEEELRGKILEVGDNAFVLQTNSDTRVIDLDDAISVIERRRGVTIRNIRPIDRDVSVRQHLADRHAILVSVLKVADEDLCHILHEKISHADLAHRHGNPSNLEALGDASPEISNE